MSNPINFKPFELATASDIKLTASGFKREGEPVKYVCKITDAVINFVGDNSKFFSSLYYPKNNQRTFRES